MLNIIFFFLILVLSSEEKVFISIGEAELKRPVIAVRAVNNTKRCIGLRNIIKRDMYFANLFTILPKKLEPPKNAKLREWKASGVEYLIKLECKRKINFQVYHLPQTLPIVDNTVSPYSSITKTAHSISNKIYKKLTGQDGIFMSKLAFIAQTWYKGRKYKNLFISDYDGKRITQLTYYKSIAVSPAWSPKGNKIAYTRFSKIRKNGHYLINPNLYLYDIKTRKETLVSSVTGQNSGAAWSRDGRYLAFTINKGRDPDIYAYDTKTKRISLLVGTPGLDVEPSFSPDGTQLVFSSSRTGNPELYVINLKTRKQTRLTYIRHYNSSPSWSPRSDIIAFAGLDNPFAKGRSNFDIFLVKSDASKIERLTIASGNNEDPTWSPDGRHIIYTSTRFGGSDLFMIHFDGTGDTRLTKKYKIYSPDWSTNLSSNYYY